MFEIDTLAQTLAGLGPIRVLPRRCLAALSPRSGCTKCRDVCPDGAVRLLPHPELSPCSGCGLCAAACPTEALIPDNPSESALLQQVVGVARREDRVAIACGETPLRLQSIISVPCLGRLSAEFLVAAALTGVQRLELVRPEGACRNCRYVEGAALLDSGLSRAQAAMIHLGGSGPLILTSRPSMPVALTNQPGARTPVYQDRRSFLAAAVGLLRETVPARLAGLGPHPSPAHLHVDSQGGESPSARLSPRRRLLCDAIAEAGRLDGVSGEWPARRVELHADCIHCGICGALCPAEAMAVCTDPSGAYLAHWGQRCQSCALCTKVCPASALRLGAPVSLADLTEPSARSLGKPTSGQCQSCGIEVHFTRPEDFAGYVLCLDCHLQQTHRGGARLA